MRRTPLILALALLIASVAIVTAQARELILESIEERPADRSLAIAIDDVLALQPGDAIAGADLIEARQSLLRSGRFETVEVYTERGSEPGRVVLIVEAELDRGTHFETGFGHEALDGWYLNLAGIRWNSPMGRGGHLRAGARLGLRTAGFHGEWYRPGGGSPDLHLRLFSGSRHWIAYEGDAEFRQPIQEGRLELGMGLRGRGGAAARVWIGFAASEPDSVLEEFGGDDTRLAGDLVPAFVPREARTVGRLELEFDRRDDSSAPRRGTFFGFSAEGALPERGAAYSRLRGDARLFLPLPQRSVLGLRVATAHVSKQAPYHQRLVFGGIGTIRGYPDAALSGALGARARWHAGAELRLPLLGLGDARPRIDGILFFDVGTHWDATGHAHRARSAVGYGLRVRVPWIQRFGIDVGIPLGEEPTDDPFWITLGLGHSF